MHMADNETQPDPDDVLLLPGWVMAAIRSELLAGHGEDDDPGDLEEHEAELRETVRNVCDRPGGCI